MTEIFWTEERLAQFRQLKDEGLSNKEMAAKLGATYKKQPRKPLGIIWYRGDRFVKYQGCRYYQAYTKHAGVITLHLQVWIDHNPMPPRGWHIHHKDRNTANNAIDNLVCLPPRFHAKLHGIQNVQRMARMRRGLKAWRASEDGRRFTQEHCRKMRAARRLKRAA